MCECTSVLRTEYRSEDTYLHVWGHQCGRPVARKEVKSTEAILTHNCTGKLQCRLYRLCIPVSRLETGSGLEVHRGAALQLARLHRGPPRVLEAGEDFSAGISLAVSAVAADTASVEARR